jgi:hypothetical protein
MSYSEDMDRLNEAYRRTVEILAVQYGKASVDTDPPDIQDVLADKVIRKKDKNAITLDFAIWLQRNFDNLLENDKNDLAIDNDKATK